ncbi:MAG: zonular occludens toxin domain-containing protein, partial [Paludibacter sp.]|nr:zonular occludens toxin domain-containing protein [Paludibacter sp.]
EESDESKYGLLVLDELGTWFNSRNWRDKGRLEVINWFLHARKLHWDIYLIVQNINSLDDQLVSALCEHLVVCKRTDRLSIPIIGPILKSLGFEKVLPKIHVAKVYYGQSTSSMAVDRWWYRGKDLYAAYNTDQIFDEESDAIHSPLPAYYRNNVQLIEKYQNKIKQLKPNLKTAHPTDGRFLKMASICLLALAVCTLSYRTYAKYTDYASVSHVIIPKSPDALVTNGSPSALPSSSIPLVTAIQKDAVRILTEQARITTSSMYLYDGKINAVLHVQSGKEEEQTITLDDARALGYVAVRQGRYVKVSKDDYSFSFMVPG